MVGKRIAMHDRPTRLRRKAAEALAVLPHEEREALLIKCWMSHDARWFAAVAMSYGMEAANRANKLAVREEGKVEARRVVRVLGLPPPRTTEDVMLINETMISLLGPDLLDYELERTAAGRFQYRIRRCFAYENVVRAGVAAQYECGIFPRVMGWLEALGVECELSPPLGLCLKAAGEECAYTFKVKPAVAYG